MKISAIIKKYETFLNGDPVVYFSPGRVNLIGEHIDYLGGHVLPTAIDLGTYAIVTKREDKLFQFVSHNKPKQGIVTVRPDQLDYNSDRGWANYPIGMIDAFAKQGVAFQTGLNILIYGTLPSGAGLSSSASLEVLIGVVLQDIYEISIERSDLAVLAQSVENNYIGVNCGIMDQFAVAMSSKDHALYLNTNTLQYQKVPLKLFDQVIVIANTNKHRALAESQYNIRRQECELGLKDVQQRYPTMKHLCDLSLHQFEAIETNFRSKTIMKRVRHAITEDIRTKEAVRRLKSHNLDAFGRVLVEGHHSIRDDFEVSCYELDVLVDAFLTHGALGARMTGAGFGGSAIAIVSKHHVDEVIQAVKETYDTKTEYEADFYICKTADGARRLEKGEWQ